MSSNYKHGSIHSLTLHNFQTYKDIRFTFHPQLNFIAGPNGSGKSSIANSLAFIFGGSTSTIGKTKDIAEYVNFNAHDASVEAKIQNNNKVVVLKRCFNKVNKKSVFMINKNVVKQKEYQQFVDGLNIDVDNLCQFLPQEKVAEFSGLSGEDLLECTLNSQSDKSFAKMKASLLEMEKINEELSAQIEFVKNKKEGIGQIVQNMSKSVEKLRERAKKEEKIKNLKIKRIWMIFEMLQKEFKLKKNNLDTLKRERQRKMVAIEESKEKIRELENSEEMKKLELERQKIEAKNAELRVIAKNLRNLDKIIENCAVDLQSLDRRREIRRNEIENIEKNLESSKIKLKEKIKEKVDEKIGPFDSSQISALENKKIDYEIENGKINDHSRTLQAEMDGWNAKLREINNEENVRMEFLRKYHNPTYQAVTWLRQNRELFEDEIIEPCLLSLKLKDKKFANEVETFLSYQILTTFICKNQRDFEKFLRILKDEKKLGINACELGNESYKNTISNDELRKLGFESMLIDLVECIPEIRSFLCNFGAFNSVPITKNNVDENVIFKKFDIKRLAARNKYLEIKKSQYNSDYLVMESYLKNLGLFRGMSTKEINSIKNRISEIQGLKENNQKSCEKNIDEINLIKGELINLYKIRDEHMEKLNAKIKRKAQIEQLQISIEHMEGQLLVLKDNSGIERDENRLKSQKESTLGKIEEEAKKCDEFLKNENFFESLLNMKKIESEISVNDSLIEKNKAKILNLEDEIKTCDEEMAKISEEMREKRSELEKYKEKIKKHAKPELMDILAELPDSIEELEIAIATESARLPFYDCDPQVEKEFVEKENEMKKVHLKLSALENKQEIFLDKIKILKIECVAKIKKLIDVLSDKFSELFSRFKCQGKVNFVHENLISSKWRLDIFVRFRESSRLELLTSTRQSGGEKSVSTMLFLLALQNISDAPFRLVDEINQGMDKYNEKIVHDILVGLSTPDSPQFFIITPKLVPDLVFGKNMKIHVIFAGGFTLSEEDVAKSKCLN